jgi:uncharacterized lipoprotein YddW (UPF0748 family)
MGIRFVYLAISLFILQAHLSYSQKSTKREFRGVWVATVANIDWPSQSNLTPEKQREEFIALLDMHKANGLNAVIVQVRPAADAFYPSRYEPWSKWLSGKIGRGPMPYYDPLQFMIDEAHQRGFEFHAWFNPYRAVADVEKKGIDSSSVAFREPKWFVKYATNLYFNPGIQEARQHTINVIMDVVHRYDVDAIHFDDYFYPYKIQGQDFPDSTTWMSDATQFPSRDDWRRNNVDILIKELSDSIRSVKPFVQFGISPFGVWRNQEKDSTGSASQAGQTCYDDLYADIVKWMKLGWIDYVVPQIYFSTGFERVRYDIMAKWWNENNYDVPVYMGQAAYRVNNHAEENWKKADQLPNQVRINRKLKNIVGSAYFSSKSFRANSLGINDSLRLLYAHPALTPLVRGKGMVSRNYPIQFIGKEDGIQLFWQESAATDSLSRHNRYVIYRFKKKEPITCGDPSKILKLLPASTALPEQTYIDKTAKRGKRYQYVVTSVDRFNRESNPLFSYSITNKKKFWISHPAQKMD